ncbi:PilZ domain-containing protein [Tepidamorphus sp. 3E244]|uniref:PilZ domain-containing protein n=1 Tax=Tepidamorphus sp. 3E244 TaxID=3385498 RepID=UPI0038FC1933
MIMNVLGAMMHPVERYSRYREERNKPKTFSRKHQRYSCCIVGRLEFPDRGFYIDGSVMEISLGGTLFRACSTYMIDRRLEQVRVHFDKHCMRGQIMNIRPEGYGIRFLDPLAEDDLLPLADAFGLQEANEFH